MTKAWGSSAAAASFAATSAARTFSSLVTAGVQYQVKTTDEEMAGKNILKSWSNLDLSSI